MTLPRPAPAPVAGIAIPPPRPFVERRTRHRRTEDRVLHEERSLLARTLDVLARPVPAEARLAGVLDLLATVAGADRCAVLAEGAGRDRRLAVLAGRDEDGAAALALGAWLDAHAPRSRARRAAAGPARIALACLDGRRPPAAGRPASRPPAFALVPIPSAGDVVLGFAFADPAGATGLEERLPPEICRHAAVALSLVTDQLATEAELDALRARDGERSRFVSTVAHELRTPLTGLSGYLDLILDGKVTDPEVEREFLDRSRAIVGTMTGLVGDLLEVARIESGTLQLEIAPFSIAETCQRVLEGLEPIALERGIALRSSLPSRLATATGDQRRVAQIVTNVAGNALKFAPPVSTVELRATFDGPAAVVCVRDAGAGIAADERARIFERFYRLDGHERIAGTGLGLPIARDLARAMGGDLDVASVPGAGTSFVLVLPGPAPVGQDVVGAVMERVLALETTGIEERALVRAVQLAGRAPVSAPRPPAGAATGGGARAVAGRPPLRSLETPLRGAPSATRRARPASRVRLRALDGGAGAEDAAVEDPAPA